MIAAGLGLTALAAACSTSDKLSFGSGGGGASASAAVGSGGEAGGSGGADQVGGAGGTGGEGGFEPLVAPPLRNPVNMSDADLAYQALILMGHQPLGATTQTCSKCHALNSGLMSSWRDLTDTAVATCFADPASANTKPAAEAVLSCLRNKPQPSAPFSTPKLGIYSAAAHLDWFAFVFDVAHSGDGATELAEFQHQVAMPKLEPSSLTQADFDIIAEWFARGLPHMEQLLPGPPTPGGCTPSVTPAVAPYMADAQLYGWRALNEANNMLMFGCAGAQTTLDCMSSYPYASEVAFGAGWEHMPGARMRVLRTNNYQSAFWTRSSADGRFVGHGGGSLGATIVDLALDQQIAVDAAYDPGFFSDNSGFIFQGAPGGTGICSQGLLSGSPASVTFQEPQCTTGNQISLYQHVGVAPGNGDHWAVAGNYVSDNGGTSATLDSIGAFFDGNADIVLTPLIFNGTTFTPKPSVTKATPFEGDFVMSPSRGLLLGRVAGSGWTQNGFVLRRVLATPNGNSYSVEIPEVARYCINGGKPGISYDERWAVLHRYVTGADAVELGFSGPADPGFAPYASQGAANVYLLDLMTGLVRRVTHMQPGQYALFPHFRSDGWIYFMVRTLGTNDEHIVASDAALTLEG